MIEEKPLLNIDKLINYFTLFVIGNIAFLILIFIKLPNTSLWNNIKIGLTLLTILSYEFVLISLISYQIFKGKRKLMHDFSKNREKYFILVVAILAITYLGFVWFRSRDITNVIQNGLITIIALVSIPQVNKKLTSWWNKLSPNKKEGEPKC